MICTMHGRVCLIGAGISGLVSIKCLRDGDLDVVCYEKDAFIGGRWHPNSPISIARSTITNTSSLDTAFSDFPISDDVALYATADEVFEYLDSYADHFGLKDFISFNIEVTHAEPITETGSDETKGWRVTVKNSDGCETTEEYDYLVVCSGFNVEKYIPRKIMDSLHGFTGVMMHSIDFKDGREFEGKNVVVIGMGSSGGDVVCEAATHSGRKAYISTSHGCYVYPRVLPGGELPRRIVAQRILQYLPSSFVKYLRVKHGDHICDKRYGLRPSGTLIAAMNDELLPKIASGRVAVKPGVIKASGKTLYFSNDTAVEDVDIVVLCTGFTRKFPFFDEGTVDIEQDGKSIPLYKWIFSPKHGNRLAHIGFFGVFGPIPQTCEMQARYATQVFLKAIKLPPPDQMAEAIQKHSNYLKSSSDGSRKEYNVITNMWKYFDELAYDIGCRPSLFWILCTDPLLFFKMLWRYSACDYRLIGPNRWSGARDAIFNMEEKLYKFTSGYRA